MENLNVTYEQFRSLVIETLRENIGRDGASQLANLRRQVPEVAVRMGLLGNQTTTSQQFGQRPVSFGQSDLSLSDYDYGRVHDVIWDLVIEGVVRPGVGSGQDRELPFFHLTEWGRKAIDEGPESPYDPDNYVGQLTDDVPDLDPIIITYLNESLRTFRIGCLLSSTISLGCASEKALLLLIGAYGDSLPTAMKTKFKQNTEGRMIKRQFDEFRKMLDSELRARLPGDLEDSLDIELTGLFNFIRTQRNDAGHPTGKTVERERAYANLLVFPVYLRKVYTLIGWVKANPRT